MNISKLIKQGESETLEFKQNFDKEVIESLSAMANRNGGNVLLGVTDRKEIKGIQLGRESVLQWLNQIGQTTEPKLIPNIIAHTVKGKTLVQIEIAPYPIKPVTYNGRAFLRVTSSNKQLNAKEISELHLQSSRTSWDTFEASDITINDINLTLVKKFFSRIKATGRRNLAGTGNTIATLQKLELIKKGKPTWACFLLFKKNPHALPASIIRVVRFKAASLIIDDNFIEGPLVNQIDQTMQAIKRNLKVMYKITGKPKRDEIWEYPLDAIREAVINSICHRDYMHNSDIQIKIFDDHMTIWNPGKLPYNLTVKELLNNEHNSNPRNKLIAQAFYDMGEVERIGSGIKRIMDACETAELPKPEIKEAEGGFYITFKRPLKNIYSVSEDTPSANLMLNENRLHYEKTILNDRQKKAVQYVKKKGKITNSEYQKLFKVAHRTASQDLTSLAAMKIFKREGKTGKGTYYILSD